MLSWHKDCHIHKVSTRFFEWATCGPIERAMGVYQGPTCKKLKYQSLVKHILFQLFIITVVSTEQAIVVRSLQLPFIVLLLFFSVGNCLPCPPPPPCSLLTRQLAQTATQNYRQHSHHQVFLILLSRFCGCNAISKLALGGILNITVLDLHMGQFLQDGENVCFMSSFFVILLPTVRIIWNYKKIVWNFSKLSNSWPGHVSSSL